MRATRPLSVMIYVLGYAAIPAWPAGVAAAIWWTGRAELLILAVAGVGTSSAMALAGRRQAEASLARRAAEYERLEKRLCEVVRDLRGDARRPPGLRVVRPSGGARAPR